MSKMTDLEKEDAYGVAWIIYEKRDGIPDTSPSKYQRRPKVIQGTIEDVQNYMESIFRDNDEMSTTDPMRGGLWYALKVSKEGGAIYGNYSVPLCTGKLSKRWDEKKLLQARSYQLATLMQDKKYDCLLNYKNGYLQNVSEQRKEELRKELEALDKQGIEISKKLTELGVSFDDQLEYIREQ